MKVWIKLLIGSVLGLVLGGVLPSDNQTIADALMWFEKLAINIGRYAVVPILVFSLIIAIYELRQDKIFWRLLFRSCLVMIGVTFVVISSGILVTLLFPPARIPILIEEQVEIFSLGGGENISALFPSNMFSALVSDGVYLFPLCVLAFFFGIGLSYDRSYTKPVIALVDALSHIFYYIGAFFSEILGVIIIALSAYWAFRYHNMIREDGFRDLILLLGIFSAILGFIIFPLLLCVLGPKTYPWSVVYGSFGPALAGFFSGDINFTFSVLVRHVKESLGVRRKVNALTLPLFTIFGRAGSAMVAVMAFIVIIKSYSSLEITMTDIFAIGIRAFIISFLLARHPGDAAYTALAVLCMNYGRGFEAGYLILKPLAFYLIAVGTFLDVMIASIATYALAKVNGFQEDRGAWHFI
ncbi:MAG: cation:dicarboxylase symporter family transporter [Treponema sp.]|jgi:Na+/H+-dicarboxylate symporter|nr:cation:dicarboxylase symporter family transporter [Treponema sp.]